MRKITEHISYKSRGGDKMSMSNFIFPCRINYFQRGKGKGKTTLGNTLLRVPTGSLLVGYQLILYSYLQVKINWEKIGGTFTARFFKTAE